MKAKKPAKAPVSGTSEVDDFMARLKHPLKAEIAMLRRIILGVSPEIGEAIKWNAPSFRTTEFFATTNLRSVDQVQFIFHLGAKVRPNLKAMQIADPAGLVKWLAKDRCMVTVGAGQDIPANQAAFGSFVRQWIKHV
jgi:hypothetical protein